MQILNLWCLKSIRHTVYSYFENLTIYDIIFYSFVDWSIYLYRYCLFQIQKYNRQYTGQTPTQSLSLSQPTKSIAVLYIVVREVTLLFVQLNSFMTWSVKKMNPSIIPWPSSGMRIKGGEVSQTRINLFLTWCRLFLYSEVEFVLKPRDYD